MVKTKSEILETLKNLINHYLECFCYKIATDLCEIGETITYEETKKIEANNFIRDSFFTGKEIEEIREYLNNKNLL